MAWQGRGLVFSKCCSRMPETKMTCLLLTAEKAAFQGFCPCIIQEAPELETADADFPPREDLCLKPQLFKTVVPRARNGMALTPCSGDTCQAFLIEELQGDIQLTTRVALVCIQSSLSLLFFVLFKNTEV